MSVREVEILEDLTQAYDGSYYTIAGCGGDLNDWVNGYEVMLEDAGIGKPARWYRVTGEQVNAFAQGKAKGEIAHRDTFQKDLTLLIFPLEGLLGIGKLPIFKMRNGDRWFDDIIDNMVRA